jgi:hypothetical protein
MSSKMLKLINKIIKPFGSINDCKKEGKQLNLILLWDSL